MSGISSSDYEEVCNERDMLKDEVNQYKYRIEQLKADLQVRFQKIPTVWLLLKSTFVPILYSVKACRDIQLVFLLELTSASKKRGSGYGGIMFVGQIKLKTSLICL